MENNIYITSDLNFGSTFHSERRGFQSVYDMNDHLLNTWNSTINDESIIYSLGNFAVDSIEYEKIRTHLKGKIIHVNTFIKTSELYLEFTDFHLYGDLIEDGTVILDKFILFYLPVLDFIGDGNELDYDNTSELYQIHGFSNIDTNIDQKRFNVKCDLWKYKPVELELLKSFIQ